MEREVREFFLESGSLALDLLNTRGAWDGMPHEQLRSPRDLSAWLEAVALQEPRDGLEPSLSTQRLLLREAHRLRDDVARLVDALTTGTPPPSHVLFGLNRVLAASYTSTSVVLDSEGVTRLVDFETGNSNLTVLAPVARAAAELLVTSEASRIRRCASDTCERWFVDTSKGGRRKWCSMATCGNRAKAEAHRERHSAA